MFRSRALRRALSSPSASPKWVPRAESDTLYTISRRKWRAEVSRLRKQYLEERRAREADAEKARAEEAAAVSARRAERLRRKAELSAVRAKEMEAELAAIQEEKARRKAINREHHERAENLERAKSLFALETLEEEKHRWIASAEELTPDRMLTARMPPGFTRPRFRVLYGDWQLPWEMGVDGDTIDQRLPQSRINPDDKKKPLPPVAQRVPGMADLSVNEGLARQREFYREQHDRLAARGLVAARSRVKLEVDRSDELARQRLEEEQNVHGSFVSLYDDNPFLGKGGGGELSDAISAAQEEGQRKEEDDRWEGAR